MSVKTFRFLHSGDMHLERPLMGMADVPDHLRDKFLEAPFEAAGRMFDAAEAEAVDFVVLCGGVINPAESSPRGPDFLVERFARLAQRGIAVYWAGSAIDPPQSWPAAFELPSNVHYFPSGRVEELLVQRDGVPLARICGTSCDPRRPWQASDFSPDAAGLFTIAAAHGQVEPAELAMRGVHYWALGGRHDRCTPRAAPRMVHYPGTTQGRVPSEAGVHGCTLLEVDQDNQVHTSFIPTDSIRWIEQRIAVDESMTAELLGAAVRQRMHTLIESSPGVGLLVSWTIFGGGPLPEQMRRGRIGAELLARLREEYGHREPPAWSVSLEAELPDAMPADWYEQETMRGDFLRCVRQLQLSPDEPLGLEQYLAEAHRAGPLAAAAAFSCKTARYAVLREAAALGVDLLTGEGPSQ
jgi:hypothetical protein